MDVMIGCSFRCLLNRDATIRWWIFSISATLENTSVMKSSRTSGGEMIGGSEESRGKMNICRVRGHKLQRQVA